MVNFIGESSDSSVRNKKDSDEREKETVRLEEKKEKQKEEILKIEANIFQLANYYFIFQGVILTAIFKDSSATPKCKYIWVPISLSLVAVFLNIYALYFMAGKYKHSLKQLDMVDKKLHVHMQEGREALLRADAQQKQLEIAKQATDVELRNIKDDHEKKDCERDMIWILSMGLLIVFAILNIVGIILIPCEI